MGAGQSSPAVRFQSHGAREQGKQLDNRAGAIQAVRRPLCAGRFPGGAGVRDTAGAGVHLQHS